MGRMKKYKNLSGSHPVKRGNVKSGSQRLSCSESISQMNSTVISGSHSQCEEFLSGSYEKYKILSGSQPVRCDVTSGSQWLMSCSGSISQTNSSVISGCHLLWEEFL